MYGKCDMNKKCMNEVMLGKWVTGEWNKFGHCVKSIYLIEERARKRSYSRLIILLYLKGLSNVSQIVLLQQLIQVTFSVFIFEPKLLHVSHLKDLFSICA